MGKVLLSGSIALPLAVTSQIEMVQVEVKMT